MFLNLVDSWFATNEVIVETINICISRSKM